VTSRSSLSPPSKKGHRWLSVAVALVGFVLLGAAFVPGLIGSKPAPTPLSVAPEAEVVRTTAPGSVPVGSTPVAEKAAAPVSHLVAPIAPSMSFDCMISAKETIAIGSSILGTIETIAVDRSDYVEAGQVLATLESRVEEAAVRVAEARADRTVEMESTRVSLALGTKRRDRALDLYESNSLSLDLREEVETEATLAELGVREAKENHRLAVLQLEQARASLERRTIRSPISGFVVERLMAAGEVVDDETILTVAQVDPLRVDVILPTHLFGAVAPGDEMEILPEPPLDRPRVAQVSIADRVLDGASGTFSVRLLLPNPDHGLPGGLRCKARLLKDPSGTSS